MQYSLKKAATVVVDVPGGKIISRPINAPVLEAARAVAQRQAREARENPDVMRRLGIGGDIDPKDVDAVNDAVFRVFLRIELGIHLMESWEGFGDETPAEVNAENIRFVFTNHPMVAKKYYDDLITAYLVLTSIKKNSEPVASGTSSPEPEKAIATTAAP